jgi:adenine specific DNA methylase Mod
MSFSNDPNTTEDFSDGYDCALENECLDGIIAMKKALYEIQSSIRSKNKDFISYCNKITFILLKRISQLKKYELTCSYLDGALR